MDKEPIRMETGDTIVDLKPATLKVIWPDNMLVMCVHARYPNALRRFFFWALLGITFERID